MKRTTAREMAAEIAQESGLTEKEVLRVLTASGEVSARRIIAGERVEFPGLGILFLEVNGWTRRHIPGKGITRIPARYNVDFRPSKYIEDRFAGLPPLERIAPPGKGDGDVLVDGGGNPFAPRMSRANRNIYDEGAILGGEEEIGGFGLKNLRERGELPLIETNTFHGTPEQRASLVGGTDHGTTAAQRRNVLEPEGDVGGRNFAGRTQHERSEILLPLDEVAARVDADQAKSTDVAQVGQVGQHSTERDELQIRKTETARSLEDEGKGGGEQGAGEVKAEAKAAKPAMEGKGQSTFQQGGDPAKRDKGGTKAGAKGG